MTETMVWAFDRAPVATVIVTTEDPAALVVLQANRAMSALMGSSTGDVVGRTLQDLIHDDQLSALAPPHGAGEFRLETRLGNPTTGIVPVTLRFAALPASEGDAPTAVVQVEETKVRLDAERALRKSEKRLQDMVDNVNALIYLKNVAGQYIFTNRRYQEMVGRNGDDIQGREDSDIWPAYIATAYAANDRAVVESGGPMEFEEPIPGQDGVMGMWLSLKFRLDDEDGVPYAVGGISTDISDRNRAEALIRSAKEEAERANRAKSDFLSRMSHELRTPLNSILGFGQLLQMEPLPANSAERADHIVRAGRHLSTLINEVLDISRIESGVQAMSVEPVAACNPLVEAVELIRPLAAARSIEVARDLHAALHRFVLADYQRLKQVLLNVLMNAVKYNQEGGMVTVSTEVIGSMLRFRITDDGFGMDMQDADRIFVPFERLEATAGAAEGTGLGLALSKTLIEAMGGAIGVERAVVGRGSVFFVDVALTDQSPRAAALWSQVDDAVLEPIPALKSLTVLYIEDNVTNLELVAEVLGSFGVPPLIAAMQGQIGIELAIQHQPDLILLDLHLPDLDGERVLRRLRADERTRHIPVVILTADATTTHMQRLKGQGAAGYVTKPLDIRSFLEAIQSAISQP